MLFQLLLTPGSTILVQASVISHQQLILLPLCTESNVNSLTGLYRLHVLSYTYISILHSCHSFLYITLQLHKISTASWNVAGSLLSCWVLLTWYLLFQEHPVLSSRANSCSRFSLDTRGNLPWRFKFGSATKFMSSLYSLSKVIL